MPNVEITTRRAVSPPSTATIWHCRECDAFVSIRSAQVLDEAFCPACVDVALEFCGKPGTVPELRFADA